MIDVLELADAFVTDLMKGNIESNLDRYLDTNSIDTDKLKDNITTFRTDAKNYTQETDHDKKIQLAHNILDFAMYYRLVGVLKNNPNMTRHMIEQLDFYKERFKILEQEKAGHETEMAGAMATIKKLKGELVGKAMTG